MAILQISRIQVRQGLQIDLPQLAGGEFGWSVDSRRLFIGNGTLDEGAPAVGNTEILTQYSNIFENTSAYTYKGQAAGYTVQTGPSPDTPISMSLQAWADQWASVKDFGAVGDGSTDDTEAINRALYQLYCVLPSVESRRSLFFPAGTYLVSDTINIPTYATLYGEGIDSSIIMSIDGAAAYVARTADSLQQTGSNIGNGASVPPGHVSVSGMSFQSTVQTQNIFLVEDASQCSFNQVGFMSTMTTADLNVAMNNTAGVRFASSPSLISNNITFTNCHWQGTVYGVSSAAADNSNDQQVNSVVITGSEFNTLYQAIFMGMVPPVVNGGASGVRIIGNTFDNIFAEGILLGPISQNSSSCNTFYDVGNFFAGVTSPQTAIISVYGDNNTFFGDTFSRPTAQSVVINPGVSYPPVTLNASTSIATVSGYQQMMGTYIRQTGMTSTLNNNTSVAAIVTNSDNLPCSIDTTYTPAFKIEYTIIRGATTRTGTIRVASNPAGVLNYQDDNIENASTGVNLTVVQTGTVASLYYTTSLTAVSADFLYSISYFN